jgi:hypothetical protein
LNGGAAPRLCLCQNVVMETAHESEPIGRAGGAESPAFEIYSATGAEKSNWSPNSTGNGGSLMIFWMKNHTEDVFRYVPGKKSMPDITPHPVDESVRSLPRMVVWGLWPHT